jgi:hypothetical protein
MLAGGLGEGVGGGEVEQSEYVCVGAVWRKVLRFISMKETGLEELRKRLK